MGEARLTGPVRIVGCGLLGTSIGLGLRARGIETILEDTSPSQLRLAVDYGAGREAKPTDSPRLIVVCTPPDVAADVIERELRDYPDAIVTDVVSVKAPILDTLRTRGADVSRYVGSHPMAGRELGGAMSGRADLFVGRPWVITRHNDAPYEHVALVEHLILDLEGSRVDMTPGDHDAAVALVSHVPQLVATLMAKQLESASGPALRIGGQGLRDVTRIAHSDPTLWMHILDANSDAVSGLLRTFRDDLDALIGVLETLDSAGARRTLAQTLAAGNDGVSRLPGKHGRDDRHVQLVVHVDDRPGQLGRLFTDMGDIGINLEEVRLEHSPGAQIGFAQISVVPESKQTTIEQLTARGWRIAE